MSGSSVRLLGITLNRLESGGPQVPALGYTFHVSSSSTVSKWMRCLNTVNNALRVLLLIV